MRWPLARGRSQSPARGRSESPTYGRKWLLRPVHPPDPLGRAGSENRSGGGLRRLVAGRDAAAPRGKATVVRPRGGGRGGAPAPTVRAARLLPRRASSYGAPVAIRAIAASRDA